MTTYTYFVHDDDGKISDKEFDSFEEAFMYAQDGLITFIDEIPYIDGVEQTEDIEPVWSWDDTWDKDEAIARVEAKHTVNEEVPVEEDINIEVEADKPEEIADLAKFVFGSDFDVEFDDPVPEVEMPEVEVPESEMAEILDSEPAVKDLKYDEDKVFDDEFEESLNEGFDNKEFDRFMAACRKLGLNTMGEVEEFSKNHGNVKDQALLVALEDEANKLNEDIDSEEYVECIWCLSPSKKCDCVHDRDFGWICKDCLPDVEAQWNRLHLIDDEDDDISDVELAERLESAKSLNEDNIFSKIGKGIKKAGQAIGRSIEKNITNPEVLDKYFKDYRVKKVTGAKEDDAEPTVEEKKVDKYQTAVDIATAHSKTSGNAGASIFGTSKKTGKEELIAIYNDGKITKETKDNYKKLLQSEYAQQDLADAEDKADSNKPKQEEKPESAGSEKPETSSSQVKEQPKEEEKPAEQKPVEQSARKKHTEMNNKLLKALEDAGADQAFLTKLKTQTGNEGHKQRAELTKLRKAIFGESLEEDSEEELLDENI